MLCDVAMKDLGEDPPVLQLPVQRLMSHPQPPLHCMLLRRIHVISGAFHLIRVAGGRGSPRQPRPARPVQQGCAQGLC